MYDTHEELNDAISEYFDSIKGEDGLYKEPPTITGLAYHLGFESRQSFYDYEKESEFSYIIKRARLRVENFAEQQMYSKTPAGAIFVLKNMGWSDKQELQHSGPNGEQIAFKVIFVEPDTD